MSENNKIIDFKQKAKDKEYEKEKNKQLELFFEALDKQIETKNKENPGDDKWSS